MSKANTCGLYPMTGKSTRQTMAEDFTTADWHVSRNTFEFSVIVHSFSCQRAVCFDRTGLRTLRVQWQRPTFASPFADGAQCRANIQLHEATSPKRSDRADGASTVPSATSSPSKPSKLSPSTNRSEPADLEPAQTEPAQPAPRDHSETRSEPAAQASTTPAKARPPLAPGWASYCDDNGREFFWDAEHQAITFEQS